MKRIQELFLVAMITLGLLIVLPSQKVEAQQDTQAGDLRLGAVYIETNAKPDNQVIAFYRHGDGTLTEAGRFSTGGSGTAATTPDFSTSGLILSTIGGRQFLLVTNSGSDDISVFAIYAHHLTVVSKISSGGTQPVSVSQHGNFVYAVNAGTGNISGFTINADGHLTSINGSSRGLSGGAPVQVLFNNDGTQLAVAEQAPDRIDVFEVDPTTGLTQGPQGNPSVGIEPFGMIFDQFGHLLVTEGTNGTPIASMSSYHVGANGALTTISGAVQTPHPFTCWIVLTNPASFESGQFGYTANFGDSTISSYFVRSDGSLVLKQAVAATTKSAPDFGSIDESVSSDGAFLYVTDLGFVRNGSNPFVPVPGSVNVFAILEDGSLALIQQVTGLPHNVQGSAAR